MKSELEKGDDIFTLDGGYYLLKFIIHKIEEDDIRLAFPSELPLTIDRLDISIGVNKNKRYFTTAKSALKSMELSQKFEIEKLERALSAHKEWLRRVQEQIKEFNY